MNPQETTDTQTPKNSISKKPLKPKKKLKPKKAISRCRLARKICYCSHLLDILDILEPGISTQKGKLLDILDIVEPGISTQKGKIFQISWIFQNQRYPLKRVKSYRYPEYPRARDIHRKVNFSKYPGNSRTRDIHSKR